MTKAEQLIEELFREATGKGLVPMSKLPSDVKSLASKIKANPAKFGLKVNSHTKDPEELILIDTGEFIAHGGTWDIESLRYYKDKGKL